MSNVTVMVRRQCTHNWTHYRGVTHVAAVELHASLENVGDTVYESKFSDGATIFEHFVTESTVYTAKPLRGDD